MKKYILGLGFLAFMASCGSDTSSNTQDEVVEEQIETLAYDIDFQWTAFKTAERVGVNGTFDDIEVVQYTEDGANATEKISNSVIQLVGGSVNTDDPARDHTIKTFFFDHLGGPIKATFGTLADGIAPVTLEMNDYEVEKKFEYDASENEITIKGAIDIIQDFHGQNAFDTLHKQCYDLHEGVTGTDVEIKVTVRF